MSQLGSGNIQSIQQVNKRPPKHNQNSQQLLMHGNKHHRHTATATNLGKAPDRSGLSLNLKKLIDEQAQKIMVMSGHRDSPELISALLSSDRKQKMPGSYYLSQTLINPQSQALNAINKVQGFEESSSMAPAMGPKIRGQSRRDSVSQFNQNLPEQEGLPSSPDPIFRQSMIL